MKLQTAYATYVDGQLVFADPNTAPRNGTEVVVTYVVADQAPTPDYRAAFEALRGRAKGEHLLEKLLASRREDLEREQR